MPQIAEVELAAYLLPRGEIEGSLAWSDIFERFREGTLVEIEVGCGKGRFLAERAAEAPDRCFLALDWGRPWLRRAARRLDKAGLVNVRLLRSDAKHVLRALIPAGSVEILHVYFPDPWPKKRHHKRRLFDPETTRSMQRILRPGGQLHAATDHAEYWEVIQARVAQDTDLRRLEATPALGGRTSNFGVKYLDQGRIIYEAVWEKPS